MTKEKKFQGKKSSVVDVKKAEIINEKKKNEWKLDGEKFLVIYLRNTNW